METTATKVNTENQQGGSESKHLAVYVDNGGIEHELPCDSYQVAMMTLMNIESLGLGEAVCVTSLPL